MKNTKELKNQPMFPLTQLLKMEEFIYFLGYLWADGSLEHNNISLEIKQEDFDNIRHILDKIFNINRINIRSRKMATGKISKPLSCFRFCNNEIATFLKENLFSDRKFGQSACKLLSNISSDLHKYFIHGYFDGDGCAAISKFKNSYATSLCFWSNINQDWTFIEKILKEEDIQYSINRKTNKRNQSYSFIQVSSKYNIKLFYKYIKSNILGLARKQEKLILISNLAPENKPLKTSKYKFINFSQGKWVVRKTINKKRITIGCFKTEKEAFLALQEFEKLNPI